MNIISLCISRGFTAHADIPHFLKYENTFLKYEIHFFCPLDAFVSKVVQRTCSMWVYVGDCTNTNSTIETYTDA